MDYTQTDIDSLAAKLGQLTEGEKAALAAAIAESAGDEVEGFALKPLLRLSLKGQPIIGPNLDGAIAAPRGDVNPVVTEEITF